MYVVGATGVGKSKFLEHIVRQDIRNWRKSKCGLLLLDPHGAVYDGVMQWLTRHSYIYNRPIIPIDLRRDDCVVAYNLLRERKAAASVITANMVDALAYVWGAGSTDATPLFARTATMVFRALYERKLTLSDALSILEHANQDFRVALAEAVYVYRKMLAYYFTYMLGIHTELFLVWRRGCDCLPRKTFLQGLVIRIQHRQ